MAQPQRIASIAEPPLLQQFAQAVVQVAAVMAGLVALIAGVWLMSDNVAAQTHLAGLRAERTSLVCQDGRMQRGNGSLRDRLFEDAHFVCTDWKTLDAVDAANPRR